MQYVLIQNPSVLLSRSASSDGVTSESLLRKGMVDGENMDGSGGGRLAMASKRRNEISVEVSRRRRKAGSVGTYAGSEERKWGMFFTAHGLLTLRGENSRSVTKDNFSPAATPLHAPPTTSLRRPNGPPAPTHHLPTTSRSLAIIAMPTIRQPQKAFQALFSKCASEAVWKSPMALTMQNTAAERRGEKGAVSAAAVHKIIWKGRRVIGYLSSGEVTGMGVGEVGIFGVMGFGRWRR